MIMATAVRWCWVSYLLLAAHATLTSTNPLVNQTAPKPLCGPDLHQALKKHCDEFPSYFSVVRQMSPPSANAKIEGTLTEECCDKPCNEEYLLNYCKTLKKQTDATTAGTLVPSSHENYDDISGGIPQPTTEKFAQTDPPSPPEIAYAGEYPDQEPLTLLPTYTSPEYTNDLLILRL